MSAGVQTRLRDPAGEVGQRAGDDALARRGAALDHRGRGRSGPSLIDEPAADAREIREAHEEDERVRSVGHPVPIDA